MLSKGKISQTIKIASEKSDFSGVFIVEGRPLIDKEFLLLFVIPDKIASRIEDDLSEDEYLRLCERISLPHVQLDSSLVWRGESRYTLEAHITCIYNSCLEWYSGVLDIKKVFERLCKEFSVSEIKQDETQIIFAS